MSFRVSTRNDNQIFTTKIFFNQQRSADFNWHSKKTNWTECQYVIFALCLLERKLTIFISIFTIYFIQRYRVCVMITACSATPFKKKKKKDKSVHHSRGSVMHLYQWWGITGNLTRCVVEKVTCKGRFTCFPLHRSSSEVSRSETFGQLDWWFWFFLPWHGDRRHLLSWVGWGTNYSCLRKTEDSLLSFTRIDS